MQISGTYFKSVKRSHGTRFDRPWNVFAERLTIPVRTSSKHDAYGLSLATFRGNHRNKKKVELVYAVGLDLDHNVTSFDDIVHFFSAFAAVVHTTWSSTPDDVRCRVFILLSRPVSADEYARVYRAVVDRFEGFGLVVDRTTSDPSRFWFFASCPIDLGSLNDERARKGLPPVRELPEFLAHVCTGRPFSVDWALHTVPAESPPPAPKRAEQPRSLGSEYAHVVERAEKYMARVDPAISGDKGQRQTFIAAQHIARGWDLYNEDGFRIFQAWNLTCKPPWTDRELRQRFEKGWKDGRMPIGEHRDARRAS